MKALTTALKAVARRFGFAMLTAIFTTAIGVFPEELRKALLSEPATALLIGAIWGGVEFLQKWLRAKWEALPYDDEPSR